MRILKIIGLSLAIAYSSAHAETWVSPVELEFKEAAPEIYQDYKQAQSLLDDYRGKPEDMDQAFQLLVTAQQKDGTHAPVLRELGRLYIIASYFVTEDRFDERTTEIAEDAILRSISLAPNYEDAYVLLGHLYTNVGRDEHALAALKKAETLGSKSAWLKNNMADVLVKSNRLDEALELAKAVASGDMNNERAEGHAHRLITRIERLQSEQLSEVTED